MTCIMAGLASRAHASASDGQRLQQPVMQPHPARTRHMAVGRHILVPYVVMAIHQPTKYHCFCHHRQMLLLVFAALLIVSAPLANAQEYDEEPVVEEVEPVATPPPAPTPAPAGSIDIEQYKALATEYLNKAAELGKGALLPAVHAMLCVHQASWWQPAQCCLLPSFMQSPLGHFCATRLAPYEVVAAAAAAPSQPFL